MALLTVENLSFSYAGHQRPALENVSFSLEAGAFVALCGPSGCGKSTLLRLLKPELSPNGKQSGQILWKGSPLQSLDRRSSAQSIGFVQQHPEHQVVTDKVWHELAFGLESLGRPQEEIRRKTAEIAAFFGLEPLFHRNVHTLSGGQKQLLNLAASLVMDPELLILDEPTSMLDPTAAAGFLETLHRVNRELGTTILLCEHRLEQVFCLCNQVLVVDQGTLLCNDTPEAVGKTLCDLRHPMAAVLPAPMEIYSCVKNALPCPATTAQGRQWLQAFSEHHSLRDFPKKEARGISGEAVLRAEDLWFQYEPAGPQIVQGLSLSLYAGQVLALVGQNGSGKSTALSLLSGGRRPDRGKIFATGPVAAVPQDPQTLFLHNTVRADLRDVCSNGDELLEMAKLCRVAQLLDRHPYDLSGGEQQRVALAKVLLTQPKILLLDEPTKGLDGGMKKILAALLRDLSQAGTAILMVSHDMEFCARYADQCCLLSEGKVSKALSPEEFFSGNLFYTTTVSRMSRGILKEAIRPEDVILACGGTPWSLPDPQPLPEHRLPPKTVPPKVLWRRILGWVSGLLALWGYLMVTQVMPQPVSNGTVYLLLFGGLFGLTLAIRRPEPKGEKVQRQPIGKASKAAALLIVLAMPLTVLFGPKLFAFVGPRSYYLTSMVVVLEGILPFFILFEGKKPQARELVLLASLCALNVAGRAAFFMVPMFKPVAALTILAAVALDAQTGFFVGSVTMLLSNMLFGQGAWTPWQMFAMGLVGFLAGIFTQIGFVHRSRGALAAFGFLAVLLIYGPIMDSSSLFTMLSDISWEALLTKLYFGVPVNLVHAIATAFFLWFCGPVILEKLDRVKVKYGLRL